MIEPALQTKATEPRTLTVLVVDDETAIRRLIVKALCRQGYDVLEAGTGEDAVRLAEEHAGDLALLLTDMSMPDMNGLQLANRVAEHNPSLAVVYMSGYEQADLEARGMTAGDAYLAKPFTMGDLAIVVGGALEN